MSQLSVLFKNHKSTISLHFRSFYISVNVQKNIPKGKSGSSHDWLTRQLNDVYVIKSRYDRYRCRSAYKLLEIDEKYHILKPGSAVVDCGAAPGSWTQVVVKKLNLGTDSDGSVNNLFSKIKLWLFPISEPFTHVTHFRKLKKLAIAKYRSLE